MGYLRRTSYATEWRLLPFESLSGHRKHEVHYWLATGRAFGHKIFAPIPLYWAWNAQEQKCVCVHCSVPVAYQVCVYTVLCKMPVFFSCKWNNKTLVQTRVVIGKTSMTHRYIQSVTCTHHNQFKRHDSTISHWMLNRPPAWHYDCYYDSRLLWHFRTSATTICQHSYYFWHATDDLDFQQSK